MVTKTRSISRPAALRKKLHAWFRKHGRDLPWRKTQDPYAIAVSEFMLQQTTVSAVIPYYLRWMKSFPNAQALASATGEEVLGMWQGLGYYSRAANLLATVRALDGGVFPENPADLRELPGFGDYTASAVAAFAFNRPVPVLDANVIRVLARLENIETAVDTAAGRAEVREAARALLPARGGRLHAGALMELGALVCVARKPRCAECPVREFCRAVDPTKIPVKKRGRVQETVEDTRLWILERGRVALEQSEGPRWRGLWMLPQGPRTNGRIPPIHESTYTITRFKVRLRIFPSESPPGRAKFFPLGQLPPMPSPHARAVAAMRASVHIQKS